MEGRPLGIAKTSGLSTDRNAGSPVPVGCGVRAVGAKTENIIAEGQ